jgi:hypothetical protein
MLGYPRAIVHGSEWRQNVACAMSWDENRSNSLSRAGVNARYLSRLRTAVLQIFVNGEANTVGGPSRAIEVGQHVDAGPTSKMCTRCARFGWYRRPLWCFGEPSAHTCPPYDTPANRPAGLALGRSGHADTSNSGPAGAAAVSDLRDRVVRLRKRRGRHSLRRRCQGKGNRDHNHLDHLISPMLQVSDR